MRIGAHESISGGLHLAFDGADEDAAEAIQVFTKNAGMWREPTLTADDVKAWKERAARAGVTRPTMSHDSYLINIASPDDEAWGRSRASLLSEVQRCVELGIDYVVFHPGSCGAPQKNEVPDGFAIRQDDGLTRIAEALSFIHDRIGDVSTRILLENAAGSGGCLGCSFDHLGTVIARTEIGGDRLGVCFDTQHAFASGYDMRTATTYEATWAEFDRHVGIARLRAFHLNDSKKPLGSRVDRHDNIGKGLLGLEPFRLLVNDPRFKEIPAVLETPWPDDVKPYRDEIALLRSLFGRTEPIAPPMEAPPPLVLALFDDRGSMPATAAPMAKRKKPTSPAKPRARK